MFAFTANHASYDLWDMQEIRLHTKYAHNIFATPYLFKNSFVASLQSSSLGLKNLNGRLMHDIDHISNFLDFADWQKFEEKPAKPRGTKVAHGWYQSPCHRQAEQGWPVSYKSVRWLLMIVG